MERRIIFSGHDEPQDIDEMIFGRGGTVPSER
jgi:hypothetical protein